MPGTLPRPDGTRGPQEDFTESDRAIIWTLALLILPMVITGMTMSSVIGGGAAFLAGLLISATTIFVAKMEKPWLHDHLFRRLVRGFLAPRPTNQPDGHPG